jgi:hypothetical protein
VLRPQFGLFYQLRALYEDVDGAVDGIIGIASRRTRRRHVKLFATNLI